MHETSQDGERKTEECMIARPDPIFLLYFPAIFLVSRHLFGLDR